MHNGDTEAARSYHDATKHSPSSVRIDGHTLDWEIQPVPYKIYETLDAIALPRDWTPAAMPALDALGAAGGATDAAAILDLPTLTRVLHLTAGIVRKAVSPDGHERYFRAAACTGALYHVDLYVICGPLPGLAAGVYHFSVHDFALRRLRAGDHRGNVVAASGAEPAIARAPVILAAASTYWRNAWKYQARAYRHCFWDSGTLLANLLAVTAAVDLPTRVVLGFVDEKLDALLALDTAREGTLALVALGGDRNAGSVPALPIEPLLLPTVALSVREVDYPAIRAMHAASALAAPDAVRAWRDGPTPVSVLPPPIGPTIALRPSTAVSAAGAETIDAVIRRRGSSRQFTQTGITFENLSTMLARATGTVPLDCLEPPGAHLTDVYLIVNAVDGLASGTYVLHRDRGALELLRAGTFRREAGHLGLGQALPADASVDVFLLADLDAVLGRYGNRGYRAAQLDAAIVGGKIYLAAYALGLGATGLTFFDDDVTAFFSPHAAGKSVMFLMAVGHARRRRG